jgi:hypothetical protein
MAGESMQKSVREMLERQQSPEYAARARRLHAMRAYNEALEGRRAMDSERDARAALRESGMRYV